VYAPLYALFLVGPAALIVDEWLRSRPRGVHAASGFSRTSA
jgi:hypothetical protein